MEQIRELPEESRRTIISSRTQALKAAPELDKADQRVQERILPKVAQQARDAFLSSWEYVRKDADA